MKKLLIALILGSSQLTFADSFNSISLQGELTPPTPIYGVDVHILSAGQVVGTASDVDLIPDADGIFSTQTYITNPWVFRAGSDYIMRLSSPTSGAIISSFSITAVPFALTVRGDSQTGDQNTFSAYGNVGIGTDNPAYRLVVSSGGSALMWVSSDGVHATKYTGDGSGLTNVSAAGDNLGNHSATQNLEMGAHKINNAGDVSAVRYQISGSTVVAVLPGSNSFGLGIDAGKSNSGGGNLFVGNGAGASNTSGYENTILGAYAGNYQTIAAENTFVGTQSGYYQTAGYENTCVGRDSCYYNSTGFWSTALGASAGFSNEAGQGNVFIGGYAGADSNGDRNIIIGAWEDASSASASNELNIGGLIVGDLLSKTIGIGQYPQRAALDVISTGTAANVYAQIWRNGSGVVVASMTSQGTLYATLANAGDNLGNHMATETLNMAGNQILGVSSLTVTGKDASGYSLSLSSGVYMPNGVVSAGILNGNGAGVTNLNAANLANGTVADARLSSNVDLINANQTISGVKTYTSSLTVVGTAMVSSTMSVQSIMADNLVGGIMYFAKSSCPNGFLKANGAAVSRTTYGKLYAAIGATFGPENEQNDTFTLPDLRGEFVRGYDDGRGVDSGRSFAAAQTDAFQGHYHTMYTGSWGGQGILGYGGSHAFADGGYVQLENALGAGWGVKAPKTDGTNGTPRTSTETRPRNIALLGCIKY